MELKIKYKQSSIISLTVLFDKNLKSFLNKIKKMNEISISRILNKEIAGPIIIDAGMKENKTRKVPDLLLYVFTERIENFTEKEKALGCPANNMINEIGCSITAFREPLRKLMDGWKDALIDVLEIGKKNNEIKKEVDSNAAATYLICSFEGARGIRKIYNDDALFNNYLLAVKEYIKSIS